MRQFVKVIAVVVSAVLSTALIASGVGAKTDPPANSHAQNGWHGKRHHGKPPQLVSWEATVDISVVGAGAPPIYHVGTQDKLRIVYDQNKVNKTTGDVRIAGLQHFIGGNWSSAAGEPASSQSIFNVNTKKLDFQRAAVHGTPIVIVFTPAGWQAIYDQVDGHMIIGGNYTFAAGGPVTCNAKTWLADQTTC